jgi:hypothetical protein
MEFKYIPKILLWVENTEIITHEEKYLCYHVASCSLVEIYRCFGDRCVRPLVQKDSKFISEYRSHISDDISIIHCRPSQKIKEHNYVTTYCISTAHITYTRVYFCLICVMNFTSTAPYSALFTTNRTKVTKNSSTQQCRYFTFYKKSYQQPFCIFPRS